MRRENECWLVEREIGGMECEKMMGWDGMELLVGDCKGLWMGRVCEGI